MDVYGRNIYRSWEWSANITGGPRATGRCVPLFRTTFLCLSSPVWFIAQLPWLTNWPPDHHLSLVPSCTPSITIYQLMILMLIHFWLQNPKHLPRQTSTLTSCPPEGGGFSMQWNWDHLREKTWGSIPDFLGPTSVYWTWDILLWTCQSWITNDWSFILVGSGRLKLSMWRDIHLCF